jgi:hypothetical protein
MTSKKSTGKKWMILAGMGYKKVGMKIKKGKKVPNQFWRNKR